MTESIFIIIIILILLMFIAPIFMQYKLYDIIDDSLFEKIKIKKFTFLFSAIEGKSVSNYGIIKPLLYVQIQGYIVAILSTVFTIWYYFCTHNLRTLFSVILYILLLHLMIVIIITSVTGRVSNKRKELNIYKKRKR